MTDAFPLRFSRKILNKRLSVLVELLKRRMFFLAKMQSENAAVLKGKVYFTEINQVHFESLNTLNMFKYPFATMHPYEHFLYVQRVEDSYQMFSHKSCIPNYHPFLSSNAYLINDAKGAADEKKSAYTDGI